MSYKGSFWFLERVDLPNGPTVGLWHLVGFRFRLVSDAIAPVPSEDAILDWARVKPERDTVSAFSVRNG